jgi:hypothetical protein
VFAVSIYRGVAIRILQAALVIVLAGAAWFTYKSLPTLPAEIETENGTTTLQILMERPSETNAMALDVSVEIYPVDVIAVRHEFFTEPRAGKRFDDFLKERMKGRSPVTTHLDKQGRGAVTLAPGGWWVHAKLSGDEELEWRLPLTVNGSKQTLQLNAQNAYTRSKTF